MSPFLHRCQCTRGFFVLRPCDAAAPNVCSICARHVCDDHWAAGRVSPACLECAAREDEARSVDDDFDSVWFYRYRHRYYSTHSYRPFYTGTSISSYYDDYDLRSFDARSAVLAADDDDDRGGGLGDS